MSVDAARVSTFAPLAVPAFRRLWAASVVSHLGTFLMLVAGPWLMWELTASPLMVSLVTTSLALPRLLLTLPAGALADAVDRRLLAMVGEWGSALAAALLAVLTWNDAITPGTLLVLMGALGVGSSVFIPAYQTLIPDLVEEDLVPAATALDAAAFNVARAVGPAIGGAFVAAGRADLALGLDAVSYLVVVLVMVGVPAVGQADRAGGGVWRSTLAGLRYVRFTRPLLLIVAAASAFMLMATSIQTLLPSLAADDLQLAADGFGLLLGAFGAGAFVGALSRERARHRVRHFMPLAMITFGVAGVGIGLSRNPWATAGLLAVAGACWVWALVTMNATVQLMTPRWVRGRAVSIYLLAVLGVQPFGAIVAGSLAESHGSAPVITVLMAITVVIGLAASRADLPVLGEVTTPTLPEDWSVPPHDRRVDGSPVVVSTTWQIDPDEVEDFLRALRRLRRHRFRTGAVRWGVFRDAHDPFRISETFQVHDWSEHLAQHRRIDEEAAAAIALARSFDRAGGPITEHLAGVDLSDPAVYRQTTRVLTDHGDLHEDDGSALLRDIHLAEPPSGDGRSQAPGVGTGVGSGTAST